MRGAAHFHQHKRHHRHQHESREGKQEDAVHGEHRGRQHHEEGQHREHVVVAFLVHREQSHHHAEQHQVHGRGEKAVREKGIIQQVKSDVPEREVIGDARGQLKILTLAQKITAQGKRGTHQDDRWRVQGSRAGQGAEPREHEKVERHLEIAFDGGGEGDGLPVRHCPFNHCPFNRGPFIGVVDSSIFRHVERNGKGTFVSFSNGKLARVRYRSHATHSRQPRQVRKEATVTSSGVCSGFPVPGFFVGAHSACVPETSATCVAERFYMFAARGLLGKQRPSDWGFECNRLVATVTRSDDQWRKPLRTPRFDDGQINNEQSKGASLAALFLP